MQKYTDLLRFNRLNPFSIGLVGIIGAALGLMTVKYSVKAPILILGSIMGIWMSFNLELGLIILFFLTIFIFWSKIFLFVVIVLGVSWSLRLVIDKPRIIFDSQLFIIAGFLGYIIFQSIAYGISYSFHIKVFAKYILIYIVILSYVHSPKQLMTLVGAIVMAGVFLSITGILEYLLHFSFLSRKLPAYSASVSPIWGAEDLGNLSSLFLLNIRNTYAFCLMFALLLGLGLTLNSLDKGKKWFWVTSMTILFFGFILPMSKTAFAALLVIAVIFFISKISWRDKGFLLFILLLLAPFAPWSKIFFAFSTIYYGILDPSTLFSWSLRLKFWKVGWNLFMEDPLFGAGVGQSVTAVSYLAEKFMGNRGVPLHNAYLTVASEMGLAGLFIYLTLILLTYRNIRWCQKRFHAQDNIEMQNIALSLLLTFIAIIIVHGAQPFLFDYPFWFLVILTGSLKQIAIKGSQKNDGIASPQTVGAA